MQDLLDHLENKKNKLIKTQDFEEYFEIEKPKKQQIKKWNWFNALWINKRTMKLFVLFLLVWAFIFPNLTNI